MKEYQKFWKAHIRPWSGLPLFPRDMASRSTLYTIINGVKKPTPLDRKTVVSEKQYISSVSMVHKKKDTYVQVFSDWQIEKHIFDTIFFELADVHPTDAKYYNTIEEAMSEIMFGKFLVDRKLEKLGVAYRSFFTAGRGFHYYLDFRPTYIVDYKLTTTKFLKDYGLLDLVDPSVIEMARIARIPYSKHLKTNRYAIYTGNLGTKQILRASKHNQIMVKLVNSLQKTKILDYLDVDIKPSKISSNKQYSQKYTDWYPDCVIRIMEKILINQHATHDERKHLAGYLMRFGLPHDEIIEYFKNTSDFQRDFCMSQIKSLSQYSNFSCRNVRLVMKDLCPGVCEYIRNVAKGRRP